MRSVLLPIVESTRPDTSRHVAADANRLRHTRDLPNDAVSVHVGLRRQVSDRDRAVQARGHPPGKVKVVLQRLRALCARWSRWHAGPVVLLTMVVPTQVAA